MFAYKKAHILLPPPHGCDVIESKASLRSSPGGRGRKSATIGTPLKLDVPLLPQKPMNNIRHKGQGRISLCAEFNFNCDMRNFCDVSGVVTTASNWYYCIIITLLLLSAPVSAAFAAAAFLEGFLFLPPVRAMVPLLMPEIKMTPLIMEVSYFGYLGIRRTELNFYSGPKIRGCRPEIERLMSYTFHLSVYESLVACPVIMW